MALESSLRVTAGSNCNYFLPLTTILFVIPLNTRLTKHNGTSYKFKLLSQAWHGLLNNLLRKQCVCLNTISTFHHQNICSLKRKRGDIFILSIALLSFNKATYSLFTFHDLHVQKSSNGIYGEMIIHVYLTSALKYITP